jgi:hypothetical protein
MSGVRAVSDGIGNVEDPRALGQRMVERLNGYQVSAAIGVLARLGLPTGRVGCSRASQCARHCAPRQSSSFGVERVRRARAGSLDLSSCG